jgi:hypothetical protein
MRLFKTLVGLLNEQVSYQDVVDAIKNRKVLVIYYDGDEPGGRGLREIEPVCLGVSKANNKVLRAWDREGSSHTAYKGEQPLPSWRLFRLDKILSSKPTGEIYNEPRPNYNFDGDKTMVSVIINAKFDTTQLDTLIKTQLPQIVNTALTELVNDIFNRRGVQALQSADFTKAAEIYGRIYKKIQDVLKRPLTGDEKNTLKIESAKLIGQNQDRIKQEKTNQ